MRLGKAPDKSLLDPIETASRDELIALQTRRLAATLRRTYDAVPAMRAKFDQHGVHPDDFGTLADLERFPFTVKADLRVNYPFGLLAVPRHQLARVHASSGTTGKPTVVGYTLNDLAMWSDVMARTIRAAGGRRGMMAHVAYGYGLFTGGLPRSQPGYRAGLSASEITMRSLWRGSGSSPGSVATLFPARFSYDILSSLLGLFGSHGNGSPFRHKGADNGCSLMIPRHS